MVLDFILVGIGIAVGCGIAWLASLSDVACPTCKRCQQLIRERDWATKFSRDMREAHAVLVLQLEAKDDMIRAAREALEGKKCQPPA